MPIPTKRKTKTVAIGAVRTTPEIAAMWQRLKADDYALVDIVEAAVQSAYEEVYGRADGDTADGMGKED